MPPSHDQEELLNGKLAELLVEQGLDARPERRESGRRMDIVVDVGGARVVLEAEAGFSAAKKREAVKDADARLKQGLTTVVFAVCYPDGATTDTLAESKPIWAARTRSELSGGADARWSEPGGIPELAEAVRQAGGAVGDADGAAQILSEALDAAVQRLSKPVRSALAREMDLPQTKVKRGSPEDGYFTAAKRAMLVVATAMLFHHRLQGHLPSDHPAGYAERWPPLAPRQCAAEPETTVGEFLEAWRAILAVDYRPVFRDRPRRVARAAGDARYRAGRLRARGGSRQDRRARPRAAPRSAGAHLSPRARYRALRRLVLYLHAGGGVTGRARNPRRRLRLVQPQRRQRTAHLRSRLRHRHAADGRRRAHPRPPPTRRPDR